jgi:hypothetical protein
VRVHTSSCGWSVCTQQSNIKYQKHKKTPMVSFPSKWLLKAVAFFFLDTLFCNGRIATILSVYFCFSRERIIQKRCFRFSSEEAVSFIFYLMVSCDGKVLHFGPSRVARMAFAWTMHINRPHSSSLTMCRWMKYRHCPVRATHTHLLFVNEQQKLCVRRNQLWHRRNHKLRAALRIACCFAQYSWYEP